MVRFWILSVTPGMGHGRAGPAVSSLCVLILLAARLLPFAVTRSVTIQETRKVVDPRDTRLLFAARRGSASEDRASLFCHGRIIVNLACRSRKGFLDAGVCGSYPRNRSGFAFGRDIRRIQFSFGYCLDTRAKLPVFSSISPD